MLPENPPPTKVGPVVRSPPCAFFASATSFGKRTRGSGSHCERRRREMSMAGGVGRRLHPRRARRGRYGRAAPRLAVREGGRGPFYEHNDLVDGYFIPNRRTLDGQRRARAKGCTVLGPLTCSRRGRPMEEGSSTSVQGGRPISTQGWGRRTGFAFSRLRPKGRHRDRPRAAGPPGQGPSLAVFKPAPPRAVGN